MKTASKIFALFCAVSLLMTGCASDKIIKEKVMDSLNNGITIDSVSQNSYKTKECANPLSSNILCADPTAVEYDGRLYVYGTNDQQQADFGGNNDYSQIKSLVVFSTDDMVNWVYHGAIDVGAVAPWIYNSWAPSIVSREEGDGKTHFYLYFSNGGAGVGVITSTDPVGPWSDPLGKPLVYQNMPGLENCPAPFDPGVCIDENGVGWLAFGGGVPADSGKVHSHVPKVVRLGKDMLSFDSEFVSIDAPYFFEASELNYIDGLYYYTYCNDWQNRSGWDYEDIPAPPTASMAYLTTKTPLDADSWEYRGAYFYNAAQNAEGKGSGMRWCNNHTHFCRFGEDNYIIHHTMLLEELRSAEGGYRSIMVDYLPMDSATGEIPITAATREGVKQLKPFDPYTYNSGTLMFTSADICFENATNPSAKSTQPGAWIYIKGADFASGASELIAEVKGKGRVEVRLDDLSAEPSAFLEFDCDKPTWYRSLSFGDFEPGVHDLYFVFSDPDIELKSWQFMMDSSAQSPEK